MTTGTRSTFWSGLLAGALCTASFVTPQSVDAQVYHLEEMNTEQIRALDRWIFVVSAHGSPKHNVVLDQAGDYFRDTFGGHMVHLTGILTPGAPLDSIAGKALASEDGFTVHAGLTEHAQVMALRSDLVASSIQNAPSITAKGFPDLVRIAHQPDWPGYFGAPRHASVALGQALLARELRPHVEAAMKILDGADERTLPRYSKMIYTVPGVSAVMDSSTKHEAAIEARQQAWLARRRP